MLLRTFTLTRTLKIAPARNSIETGARASLYLKSAREGMSDSKYPLWRRSRGGVRNKLALEPRSEIQSIWSAGLP